MADREPEAVGGGGTSPAKGGGSTPPTGGGGASGGGGAVSGDPHSGNRSRFQIVSRSLQEEDAFDVMPLRTGPRSGVLFSIMNLAKGGLGGGVLAGHAAYMAAGYMPGIILNVFYGLYLCFNMWLLGLSVQRLCRRCQVADMTYSDLGEAAFALFPNPKVAAWSRCYRLWINFVTCTHLFGACATYQLMIAKSIKQLVEGSTKATIAGQDGHPNLRVYVAAMMIPVILLCLITQIKYLAPFSLVGNAIIGITLMVTIYYAAYYNPKFEHMVAATSFSGVFTFTGMSVFSLSCVGVIIPVENNMREPKKFTLVLFCGYAFIISAVFIASFFGYAAFLEKCTAPLTMNFPLQLGPKILKVGIIVMIYVTHALNFFMPFQCLFYYIKPKFRPENHFKAELFFRTIIVIGISLVAISFPNIDALMGFLGCFALSNLVIICPNTIYAMVHYERPGTRLKFILIRAIILCIIGLFILICGSFVNGKALIETLIRSFSHHAEHPKTPETHDTTGDATGTG